MFILPTSLNFSVLNEFIIDISFCRYITYMFFFYYFSYFFKILIHFFRYFSSFVFTFNCLLFPFISHSCFFSLHLFLFFSLHLLFFIRFISRLFFFLSYSIPSFIYIFPFWTLLPCSLWLHLLLFLRLPLSRHFIFAPLLDFSIDKQAAILTPVNRCKVVLMQHYYFSFLSFNRLKRVFITRQDNANSITQQCLFFILLSECDSEISRRSIG